MNSLENMGYRVITSGAFTGGQGVFDKYLSSAYLKLLTLVPYNLTPMSAVLSLAMFIIASKVMLNSGGERIHPCKTAILVLTDSVKPRFTVIDD